MSYYREQLESYLGLLEVNVGTVIDVGGKQKPVKGRTKNWKVDNYAILDLPEYNLDHPFYYASQADVVFCLEVFEYLLIPTVAMTNIANLIKPEGKAYVTFPFIYPLHNEVEFDSLRYTKSGIARLASYAGLQIENIIERKTKTNSLIKYYSEDGMKAAKGHNHAVTGFIVIFNKGK
jgi:2-polyprenyl-3-methyl-5-hydroxy-6-metoxy-1,4-benzoquinol methylase